MESTMKRGGGCEVEARGINYHISISSSKQQQHPLAKIWSRPEEPLQQQLDDDSPSQCPSTTQQRRRLVLRDVTCRARPGELLAIVGPSGAGKSTLLEILAGRLHPTTTCGELRVNGGAVDAARLRRLCGYVTQRDVLFPLLTVRETLHFSARLRGSAGALARVDAFIRNELALGRVADTRVKDLSGGERRRVSVGVECVHGPAVLFLDEPTSGLDSASALQIVSALRAMASGGRGTTVVLSIHQPGARIVKMLDSVLLLAAGSVLHHGTVDALCSLLSDAGLVLPPHVDAVEFSIDSIDHLRLHHKINHPRHRCTLQHLFHKDDDHLHLAFAEQQNPELNNSWAREVAILSHRFVKNVSRTRQLFACRTVCMLLAGLALGSIFYDMGEDKTMERVGLFAFLLTFLLSSTTEALPIFLQERDILAKETSSGAYRVSTYAVANAAVFLPFNLLLAVAFAAPVYWLTGLRRTAPAFAYFLLLIWLILYTANSVVVCFAAAAPDFVVGNAAIQGVMGSFFLFSGYFIRKADMPGYWVGMHYLSLFKWPFEALLVNEFHGSYCVVRSSGVCLATGDEVLRKEGLGEECRWRNVGVMLGFVVFYRVLGYVLLRLRCSLRLKAAARSASASACCCLSSR